MAAAASVIVLYAPTSVESRYSLPVYPLLAAPFALALLGVGRARRHSLVALGIFLVLVLLGGAWLSLWIDDQAVLCESWSYTLQSMQGCLRFVGDVI